MASLGKQNSEGIALVKPTTIYSKQAKKYFDLVIGMDMKNARVISRFTNLKALAETEKFSYPAESLGLTIETLYSGMRTSNQAVNLIWSYSNIAGVVIKDLALLLDSRIEDNKEEDENGFILTSPPDASRTRVIQRWSDISSYSRSPRAVGFETAIRNVTDIALKHIDLYTLIANYLNVKKRNPLFDTISHLDDWESVWDVYNKMIFGQESSSVAMQRLRSLTDTIGLNNKITFEGLVLDRRGDSRALNALQLIHERFTR